MFENKNIRLLFYGLTALALTVYFAGLPIDVTRDAGKYATVAKEIFKQGNFINLTVHQEPYDQKPPLLFWLGALGFAIGGISNFWFKFPVLLVVFFGFYSAYRLGKSLYNSRVGFLTAFMMLFSVIYPLYSMDIHTDTPMQAFITFALWQLSDFIKTKKNRSWILGFTGIGLAMLCKGPIGAAIPAFAIIGHLLLKKDYTSFTDYRWYLGILMAFLVVSPALIGLLNQFGLSGLIFFFWENNIGRVTGTYVQTNSDPLFYFHNLLYLFLPWSLLFFIAAFLEIKTLVKNKFRAPEYFTFTGIWIFFIILNASKSQLPNYIFGIMPLIALLTAKWTDIALRENPSLLKVFYRIQTTVSLLLWAGIWMIMIYLFPPGSVFLWIGIIAGMAASGWMLFRSGHPTVKLLIPSAIVLFTLFLILNLHVFPYMFSFQAPPRAARTFNQEAGPGDTLYNYHYTQYELFFYSDPQAIQLKFNDQQLKAVAGKEGNWIFTDAEGYQKIRKLTTEADTVYTYQHLYLNRGARFINPKTRAEVLKPMYLIKY